MTDMTQEEASNIVRPYVSGRFGGKREPGCCCARMFNNFDTSQCRKPTKITIGTLEYCGLHNPVTKKAKNAERQAAQDYRMAEWTKNRDAEKRRTAFRTACTEVVRAIALGHNDPSRLCTSLLAEYPEFREPENK